jgi:hypothetical protein
MIEIEIKTFHDKQKLKECMNGKPALQKIYKGMLPAERKTDVIRKIPERINLTG